MKNFGHVLTIAVWTASSPQLYNWAWIWSDGKLVILRKMSKPISNFRNCWWVISTWSCSYLATGRFTKLEFGKDAHGASLLSLITVSASPRVFTPYSVSIVLSNILRLFATSFCLWKVCEYVAAASSYMPASTRILCHSSASMVHVHVGCALSKIPHKVNSKGQATSFCNKQNKQTKLSKQSTLD